MLAAGGEPVLDQLASEVEEPLGVVGCDDHFTDRFGHASPPSPERHFGSSRLLASIGGPWPLRRKTGFGIVIRAPTPIAMSALVVVSPIAGLLADSVGFGQALGSAAVSFAASALLLALSPFRWAHVT